MIMKFGKVNTKKEGWQIRQKDSSWGYAVAHIIPLVGIYYAASKRTITPFVYTFIGSLIISFFAPEEKAQPFALLATPFLSKAGIAQAKKYGALKIKELKIDNLDKWLMESRAELKDKFVGTFISWTLADALGAPYESGFLERILWKLFARTPTSKIK